MRVHSGTMLAGVVYLILGVAFILEALDVWTVRLTDLRLLVPGALVVIGIAVLIGTVGQRDRQT
jgi:hypothetical protein